MIHITCERICIHYLRNKLMFCGNWAAKCISSSPIFYGHARHIKMDFISFMK